MKKYIIISLLVLLIGAMVVGPLFNGNSSNESSIPATFDFKDNLATVWNREVKLKINVNNEDIDKLELIYNDTVFQTWKHPSEVISYNFNASYFGLGARSLILQSTLKDGSTYSDNRIVRVLSDVKPAFWSAEILKSYPHDVKHFTQGYEFDGSILIESTGQRGESMVAKVDLNSSKVLNSIGLDATYFGEGITIINNKIFQLTWQEQKCFVYDKNSLQLLKDIPYTGEGWGLCNDGNSIIMSDGSERISFRNPSSFAIERVIEVYDNAGPITNLNELEYVNGKIYANVWMTDKAVVINPLNGKVEAIIDGAKLVSEGKGLEGDVMNGIAYNKLTKKLYFTGKKWNKVFEVKLTQPGV